MRVTTADFIKHYGRLADGALSEPLTITKNGRDRLVVLSAAEYERLTRRDRRVIGAGELTETELALIAATTSSAERDDDNMKTGQCAVTPVRKRLGIARKVVPQAPGCSPSRVTFWPVPPGPKMPPLLCLAAAVDGIRRGVNLRRSFQR